MRSKGKKYPRKYSQQRKQNVIANQKATPTEKGAFPEAEEQQDNNRDYATLREKNRVPVEKSVIYRIADSLKEIGAILASIVIFVAVIIWAARIEFKVEESTIDINSHKESIKTINTKVQSIDVFHAGLEKDINHLKENQRDIKDNISSLHKKIETQVIINKNNANEKKANK